MSYEPTNWKSGDVVTSAKLNKLEQGVANGGGGILVKIPTTLVTDPWTLTLGKTGQEILDYVEAGRLPYIEFDQSGGEADGAFQIEMLTAISTEISDSAQVASYSFTFKYTDASCASLSDYPTVGN